MRENRECREQCKQRDARESGRLELYVRQRGLHARRGVCPSGREDGIGECDEACVCEVQQAHCVECEERRARENDPEEMRRPGERQREDDSGGCVEEAVPVPPAQRACEGTEESVGAGEAAHEHAMNDCTGWRENWGISSCSVPSLQNEESIQKALRADGAEDGPSDLSAPTL